jgi:hypothetical protein
MLMHLYQCTDCVVAFSVEAHKDIDQSDVVCNICKIDDHLEDVAYGFFTETNKP